MPNGMGITDPKLAMSVIKLKEVKHCTIPQTLNKMKKKRASEQKELN